MVRRQAIPWHDCFIRKPKTMKSISLDQILIVNNLEELKTACKSDSSFISCPESAIYYMGLEYIKCMVNSVENDYPTIKERFVLNICDNYSIYQEAFSSGFKHVLFTGDENIANKLLSISKRCGITLYCLNRSVI